jgi:HEAT repeat protein
MTDARGVAARRALVVVAGHVGDLEVVHAALGDPAPEVRSSALAAAARLGSLDAAALRSGLEDQDADVRARACRVAAAHEGRLGVALDALVDRLDDLPVVAEVACFACGERSDLDERGVRRLVEVSSGHEDALVREAAVAALGSLADLGVVDRLGLAEPVRDAVVTAGGDVAAVRRRVAVATAAFEGDEVEALLDRLVGDRDQQVRQIAEDLRAIGSPDDGAAPEQPVTWVDRRTDDAPQD